MHGPLNHLQIQQMIGFHTSISFNWKNRMKENNNFQLFGYIKCADGNILRILLNAGPSQFMNLILLMSL